MALGVPLGGFRGPGAARVGEEHLWELKGRAGLFGSCDPTAANQQLVEEPESSTPRPARGGAPGAYVERGGGRDPSDGKRGVDAAREKTRRRAEKRARREEAVRFLEAAGLRLSKAHKEVGRHQEPCRAVEKRGAGGEESDAPKRRRRYRHSRRGEEGRDR